jgi:tritrans,polycis-undecaprenyl-diphosphate synthase [geranylgeranyl-diphosphate specific]
MVLDGNRRFARDLLKKPWEGHKAGLSTGLNALQWACKAGIKYVTAYVLSLENYYTRPKRELKYILKYLGDECDRVILDPTHVIHRFNIKVNFIGKLSILPKWIQKKAKEVEALTSPYKNHILNIALAYGGQQEITDAIRKIAEKAVKGIINPSSINSRIVQQHLYTNGQPAPDLILRTGGEKRLSNFLTFQSAYSELTFLDKRWPEITETDFNEVIAEFEERQRRFGR